MIVVLSDTHSSTAPEFAPALRDRLTAADWVVHAGDFTTEAALDEVASVAESFVGVSGNADSAAVTERLPETTQVSVAETTIALTHHIEGGVLARRLFGQSHGADVVVTGHTHRPTIDQSQSIRLLNPGSHRRPRGGPPTFLTLRPTTGRGQLWTTDGTCKQEFSIRPNGGT